MHVVLFCTAKRNRGFKVRHEHHGTRQRGSLAPTRVGPIRRVIVSQGLFGDTLVPFLIHLDITSHLLFHLHVVHLPGRITPPGYQRQEITLNFSYYGGTHLSLTAKNVHIWDIFDLDCWTIPSSTAHGDAHALEPNREDKQVLYLVVIAGEISPIHTLPGRLRKSLCTLGIP